MTEKATTHAVECMDMAAKLKKAKAIASTPQDALRNKRPHINDLYFEAKNKRHHTPKT